MNWSDAAGSNKKYEGGFHMENDKLILALDVNTLGEAEELVLALKDVVGTYKIGMQLYYGAGNKAVEMVHRHGGKVFLDLKLHDIPNTVAHAARVLTGYGVEMFNIHTSGGKEMMSRTREAVLDEAEKLGLAPPLLVGVTVLTSIDDDALNTEIGIPGTSGETVMKWTDLAFEAGLDGVVASPREAKAIKEKYDDKLIVTPGIRPLWAAGDDQRRVLAPGQALEAGATHLVVGRPITKHRDPREGALKILEEMKSTRS